MTNMISVATGFQSSVNIAYDMNDDAKLKNYIPTKSALSAYLKMFYLARLRILQTGPEF